MSRLGLAMVVEPVEGGSRFGLIAVRRSGRIVEPGPSGIRRLLDVQRGCAKSPTTLTRRDLVLTSLAAALLPGRAAFANDVLSIFLTMSRDLTGRTDLSPTLASVFLEALLNDDETAPAAQRVLETGAQDPSDIAMLRRAILRQWYTGLVQTEDGQRVATYREALMWDAMGFELPIGTCRSTVGSWSEPPAW